MSHSPKEAAVGRKAVLRAGTALMLALAGPTLADGGSGGDASGGGAGTGGAGGTPSSPDGGDGGDGGHSGGGGGGSVDRSTGIGGTGGDGGDGGGAGGSGGAGGTPAKTTATNESNTSDLTGNHGANGADGSGAPSGGGGAGGGGGFGWVVQGTGASGNTATITGGAGGGGGHDYGGTGGGGGGGQGGGGVLLTNGGSLGLSAASTITGGGGGDGGRGDAALSHAGAGGDGGAGIVLTSGGSVTNSGTTAGGSGGSGGNTGDVDGGTGGTGGAGIGGSGFTLVNSGVIAGGVGGAGGSSDTAGAGDTGAGGAGVAGSNLAITNAGEISGGLSGDGVTRAAAIRFTGGTNRLEIWDSATITGIVDASGGTDDTFALGGAGGGTFNVGAIGGSGQHQGFEAFEKAGASTWTLTGTTAAVTPWTLIDGTLSVSANANLGAASGGLTFAGGTLATTASFDSARSVALDSNGIFNTPAGTTLGFSGVVSGAGDLVKQGAGTLRLTGANSYGDTQITAGTLIGTAGSISGDVANAGSLVFDQGADATFAGAITGLGGTQGPLSKIGAGTLTLTGSVETGLFDFADGTVTVSGSGELNQPTTFGFGYYNTVGGESGDDASLVVANGGGVSTEEPLSVGQAAGATGHVSVTGENSSLHTDSLIILGLNGTGSLTVDAAGQVTSGGSLYVGGGNPGITGTGRLTVSGNGSTVDASGLQIANHGNGLTGTVTLGDGGTLDASGPVSMGLDNPDGAATLNIGANSGDPDDAVAPGVLDVPELRFYEDSARLNFNHTGTAYSFDAPLVSGNNGAGVVNHYAGTTLLTGDSSGFSGDTVIHGGTLAANATLGGTVTVEDGGTLGGSGTVGTSGTMTTVQSGGTIAPGNSIGTLDVAGGLMLNNGAVLDYELGGPGTAADPAAGVSDRIAVAGDLTLDGTVNLTQSADPADGTAGIGYYRLMTYGGALTDNDLESGTTPALADPAAYAIQTGGGNVDLFVAATGDDTLQHWQGGDGTWNASNAKWFNQGSTVPVTWAGNTAIFKDQPGGFDGGTITVNGTQSFKGLQFVDEGYRLQGSGALQTVAGDSEIRVLADRAEIATAITGTGGIVKTEAGTLVLEGANSYSGGTAVSGGTLSVSADTNLGDAAGGLRFAGGTLAITADGFTSSRAVMLDTAGTIQVDTGTSTVSGVISDGSGTGSLTKTGTGTLRLTGANTYTGGTALSAGTLSVSADGNLGAASGGLTFAGGTLATTASFDSVRSLALDSNGRVDTAAGTTLGLSGVLSGAGDLVKQGAGTLRLTGANAYGDTQVAAGSLIGNAGSISGNIANAGSVVFDQGSDASFAGTISGTGGLSKTGTGTLTLTGANSYTGGTTIAAGSLHLGDGGTSGLITGDVTDNAALAFDHSDAVTVGGVISGSGSVSQIGSGVTTLTSTNTYTGGTAVDAGTLAVNGSIAGDASVANGGTLGGSGSIGGVVTVADGGTLVGTAGQALGMGALALSGNSNVNVALGAPSNMALFDVAGDVTLDGTLNVTDAGGFGAGVYRIVDYGGALTDNGLAIGTTPSGTAAGDLYVQTATADQVNLIDTAGQTLSFWDGGNAALRDNGAVDGGAGTWQAGDRNWTGMNGAVNGPYRPNPTLAVFEGTGSTVTVDDTAGAIAVTGMQFAADGYQVAGDAVGLAGAGGATEIRVGDGTAGGAAYTATIASELTGDSQLMKTDLGTLTLTGTNTYTGGTAVSAGMLIGNVSSIRGGIANAGTVVFDEGSDTTFAGAIAGLGGTQGTMVKQGGGTLTLAGMSSLDWSIDAGGLVTSANRFTGDAVLGAGTAMTFDQSGDGIYAGMISGAGDLSKTGSGQLTFNGQNTYTGATTVAQGRLVVGDDTHGSASLAGVVTVADGASLGGKGTIGGLVAGGTIAPGNSIGTLDVSGDVTFASGSTYAVEVDPAGTRSDLVHATGTAQINGGTVQQVGLDGVYAPTSTYTILTADSGVTGTFDAVGSNYAFLNAALGYDVNDVTLTLSRNDIGFADIGNTANQRAAASGVESLGFGNAIHGAVVPLDAPTARTAFDQLSGEAHASVKTAMIEDSHFVRDAVTDRIRAAFGDDTAHARPVQTYGYGGPRLAAATTDRFAAWGYAFGAWGETNGDGNAAKIDYDTGGFLIGADGLVADTWRLGILGGYSRSTFHVDDRGSSGDSDNYHLGVYGGRQWGALTFSAGAAYVWHDVEPHRSVAFPGFANRLDGDYNAGTAQVFGELGYTVKAGQFALEPFANLAYVNLHTDGFSETGGAAALSVDGDTTDSTFSTVGVHAATEFAIGTMTATARGTLGWRHAYGDVTPDSTNAFAGGETFTVSGVPIARDAAVIDAGLDIDLTDTAKLGVSYTGQFGDGATQHGFDAKLSVSF